MISSAEQVEGNGTESKDEFSIWTVYEHPLDHPDKFVARRWGVRRQPFPTNEVLLADDLESLRSQMPKGLILMPRQPGDDPVIVETWI